MRLSVRRLYALAALGWLAAAAVEPAPADIAKGPYLSGVSESAVTVCWVSTGPEKGVVRYRAAGSTDPWRTVKERHPSVYHRVKLQGLAPHERYVYEVQSGSAGQGGAFSAAASPEQPFHFAVYGDNRTQADVHASVIARILRFEPDFVLNTGDLVANGADESMWSVFFRTAEPLLRVAPYYPVMGNHEGEASPYFMYFGRDRYYSFNYGDVHVAGLDTNLTGAEWAREARWLKRDLARNQKATWRIVFMHHPLYSCTTISSRREAAAAERARLEPILLAEHVQLVFAGHDHNYQRHQANGITYVIAGGGGAPLYDLRADTPYVKAAAKSYHECQVTVDDAGLRCDVITPDGKTIDRFALTAK